MLSYSFRKSITDIWGMMQKRSYLFVFNGAILNSVASEEEMWQEGVWTEKRFKQTLSASSIDNRETYGRQYIMYSLGNRVPVNRMNTCTNSNCWTVNKN